MDSYKVEKLSFPSFRRKPESSKLNAFWMPVADPVISGDQVRNDDFETFYEIGCLDIFKKPSLKESISNGGWVANYLWSNTLFSLTAYREVNEHVFARFQCLFDDFKCGFSQLR